MHQNCVDIAIKYNRLAVLALLHQHLQKNNPMKNKNNKACKNLHNSVTTATSVTAAWIKIQTKIELYFANNPEFFKKLSFKVNSILELHSQQLVSNQSNLINTNSNSYTNASPSMSVYPSVNINTTSLSQIEINENYHNQNLNIPPPSYYLVNNQINSLNSLNSLNSYLSNSSNLLNSNLINVEKLPLLNTNLNQNSISHFQLNYVNDPNIGQFNPIFTNYKHFDQFTSQPVYKMSHEQNMMNNYSNMYQQNEPNYYNNEKCYNQDYYSFQDLNRNFNLKSQEQFISQMGNQNCISSQIVNMDNKMQYNNEINFNN